MQYQRKLTGHLKVCRTINPANFDCDHCGKRFPAKGSIRQHMEMKHSSERRFGCCECGAIFKNKQYLQRHSRPKKINKCASCDIKFSCKLLLDRHLTEFHGNVFKCPKCPYQTKSNIILNKHSRIHDKSVVCIDCETKFARQDELKLHQMQHRHGIYAAAPEKTIDCDRSDRKCSSQIYLKIHQRQMHKIEATKCKVCDEICKNRHSLYVHSLTHSAKILACDHCGYTTKTKSNFKMHMERHLLKKLLNDSKNRNDFSDVELLEKLQLKNSYKPTSREKKFDCGKCSKSFATRRLMNEHTRRVHPKKLFDCSICKKAFKTKSYLKTHKARVHSEVH